MPWLWLALVACPERVADGRACEPAADLEAERRCLSDTEAWTSAADAPTMLSQTGCFDADDRRRAGPELVPYQVNAPLWSDGAGKRRWLSVPPAAAVDASEEAWDFPPGSVLIKEFAIAETPVETRFMVRQSADWLFFTYVWDDDGIDAGLADAGGSDESFSIGERTRRWSVPSRETCTHCHLDDQRVLGPTVGQLDRDICWDDALQPQLDGLLALGVLSAWEPTQAAMPDPYSDEGTLETRARAWLHANCAHCHRPGGWTPGMDMDLRYSTPFAQTATCDVSAEYWVTPWQEALVIRPGSAAESMLWTRLDPATQGSMPATGTLVEDAEGLTLVAAWIDSLESCP